MPSGREERVQLVLGKSGVDHEVPADFSRDRLEESPAAGVIALRVADDECPGCDAHLEKLEAGLDCQLDVFEVIQARHGGKKEDICSADEILHRFGQDIRIIARGNSNWRMEVFESGTIESCIFQDALLKS